MMEMTKFTPPLPNTEQKRFYPENDSFSVKKYHFCVTKCHNWTVEYGIENGFVKY